MLSGLWGTFFIVDEDGRDYGCFSTFDEAARALDDLECEMPDDVYLSIVRD